MHVEACSAATTETVILRICRPGTLVVVANPFVSMVEACTLTEETEEDTVRVLVAAAVLVEGRGGEESQLFEHHTRSDH